MCFPAEDSHFGDGERNEQYILSGNEGPSHRLNHRSTLAGESVLLRHETNGDAQWNLSSRPSALPQGWTHFDVPVPSTERSTVQLIHQDGAILLHFGGYLEE